MSCGARLVTAAASKPALDGKLAPKVKLKEVECFFSAVVMRLRKHAPVESHVLVPDPPCLASRQVSRSGDVLELVSAEVPISNPPAAPSRPASARRSMPLTSAVDERGCTTSWNIAGHHCKSWEEPPANERLEIVRPQVFSVRTGKFVGDTVQSEIAELCKMYPEIAKRNEITRLCPGRYLINGREVTIHIATAESGSVVGRDLIVRDGPLTQPFQDYVLNTGNNEQYELPPGEAEQRSTPLLQVEKRLELDYTHGVPYAPCDRYAAMQLAMHEAWMRDDDARKRLELQKQGVDPVLLTDGGVFMSILNNTLPAAAPAAEPLGRRLFSEIVSPEVPPEQIPPFEPEEGDDLAHGIPDEEPSAIAF